MSWKKCMISFAHFINKIVNFFSNYNTYTPHVWKPTSEDFKQLFKQHGEGFYLINLKAGNSGLSKIIGKFSDNISHTVLCLYSERLETLLSYNKIVRKKIESAWDWYYGYSKNLFDSDVCAIIIASATENGMLCYDFSKYQNRKKSIRHITSDETQIKQMLEFLAMRLDAPYDVTGLVMFLLKHGDDPNAYFCSEIVFDACQYVGIIVANNNNPSPGDIEKCLKDKIIYSDL